MSNSSNRGIFFIFFTMLIDVIGFGIIIPVLPALISDLGHVTTHEAAGIAGWLLASFAITQFFFSPLVGNLSDHFGRRPILLLSLAGFFFDYLILIFAPDLTWLFVGRILAGLFGASFTTCAAYIADISTTENRAKNFGMIGAAFGLGFVIGPGIGGGLAGYGLKVPFMVTAGLTLVNILYGYLVLPESLPAERRRKFDWKKANPIGSLRFLRKYPLLMGLVTSLVLIYIAAHAVQGGWSYYTIEKFGWGSSEVGYSLVVVGIMVAVVQGFLIRIITPALGGNASIYLGLTLYSLGFALFGVANQSWMLFVFLIPYCLGGIAGPSLQSVMTSQVQPNEQGELQGALTSLISLTSIVGPLLMLKTFSVFSDRANGFYFPGAAMELAAVLTLFSLFFAWRTLGSWKRPVKS